MDITESVVCSHCNTRVYRQWLVDHLQQELQSITSAQHCSPCSNILQALTDLLCALHQYGHQKTPLISITCSRCCFKAGTVEKFVEHLQLSCENAGDGQETGVVASHAPAEQSSFTYRVSYQPDVGAKGEGEGGSGEQTATTCTSSQGGKSEAPMGDWDGQQFQQMMSTLLTDTLGKGRQKSSSEQDKGQYGKVTIDMASVHENAESESADCEGSRAQAVSSQSMGESTTNEEDTIECSSAKDVNLKKTAASNDCDEGEDLAASRKKNNTKKAKRSRAKKQHLESLLKCHMCGYSGQKKEDLESHMLGSHGKVEYKCNSCTFMGKSLRNLRRHQLGHQRMHQCKYCDFTTRWQKNLILHERRHTGEGMIKCDQCDYVTPKKDSLLRHQVKHTGIKPFVCGQCSKTFARKGDLKQHELRHAGIKSAMCHVCGDTFFKNYELVHHIQAKHDGLKLYKCDQCPFETAYFHSLVTHGRAYHTGERPYRCDFEGCNYGSANKSQLNVHRRKHTGEKPFKCTMCNYASADNAGLRKHVRKHSTLRPYKCNMCDFDTKHSFLLRKHMETAHNVMTDCKIGRRQLASIVPPADADSFKNQVPMDVFNQDLKTGRGQRLGQGELYQHTGTNVDMQDGQTQELSVQSLF